MQQLEKTIESNLARSPEEVRARFQEIESPKVELPEGDLAICSIPRGIEQLPFTEDFALKYGAHEVPGNPPISKVMREDKLLIEHPDVGMHIFPQSLLIHEKVTKFLQEKAAAYMQYCPKESTWVQEHLGAAYAIGRYDVYIHPDGQLGVCEIDGEASLWGHALLFHEGEGMGYLRVGREES